jgi:N-methylhydantoinase B
VGPDDIVISNDPTVAASTCPISSPTGRCFTRTAIGFVGTLPPPDVGGLARSYGSGSIEIFQEGLRIPPVKLLTPAS